LAEGKLVLHDLQDLLFSKVGDVHQEKWWSMAGGEVWRRPWWQVHVLGEGPVNMEGWSAHELWGCYSRTWFGRRWGGRGSSTVRQLGFSPAAMAAQRSAG
jgi:hypothetical protein